MTETCWRRGGGIPLKQTTGAGFQKQSRMELPGGSSVTHEWAGFMLHGAEQLLRGAMSLPASLRAGPAAGGAEKRSGRGSGRGVRRGGREEAPRIEILARIGRMQMGRSHHPTTTEDGTPAEWFIPGVSCHTFDIINERMRLFAAWSRYRRWRQVHDFLYHLGAQQICTSLETVVPDTVLAVAATAPSRPVAATRVATRVSAGASRASRASRKRPRPAEAAKARQAAPAAAPTPAAVQLSHFSLERRLSIDIPLPVWVKHHSGCRMCVHMELRIRRPVSEQHLPAFVRSGDIDRVRIHQGAQYELGGLWEYTTRRYWSGRTRTAVDFAMNRSPTYDVFLQVSDIPAVLRRYDGNFVHAARSMCMKVMDMVFTNPAVHQEILNEATHRELHLARPSRGRRGRRKRRAAAAAADGSESDAEEHDAGGHSTVSAMSGASASTFWAGCTGLDANTA